MRADLLAYHRIATDPHGEERYMLLRPSIPADDVSLLLLQKGKAGRRHRVDQSSGLAAHMAQCGNDSESTRAFMKAFGVT